VNEQAEAGWRRQTLIHPGPDCRKVVRRRAPPRDLGLNAPDSLDGGGLRGASRGLGSRAIKDWVLVSEVSVAEVGERHLACDAEVGREAHQGGAG